MDAGTRSTPKRKATTISQNVQRQREYIGSGHVAKADDRIVARRQMGRGTH
jgi:hypothetical protein